jgi:DNA-binding NarL/FixJ family response regulator
MLRLPKDRDRRFSIAQQERIAVALAIADGDLRERALRVVTGCEQRLMVAADIESADVVIADTLAAERSLSPELPVIVIGERRFIVDALRRGYAGALLPSFTDIKLRLAIEAAAHGLISAEAHVDPTFDDEADGEGSLPELTLREVEVLQQLITGASNKEIARRLDISIHTAKFHVASIAGKLGASGRTEAVARAMRLARSMI